MSWICPECGCECPPTDQECARCAGAAAPTETDHRQAMLNFCDLQALEYPFQDNVGQPIVAAAAFLGGSIDCADSHPAVATETIVPEEETSEIENLAAFAAGSDRPVIVAMPSPRANEDPVGFGHLEFSALAFANTSAVALPSPPLSICAFPLPMPPSLPALIAPIELPKPGFRAWVIPAVVALVIALAIASTLQKFLSAPDKFGGKGLTTVAAASPPKPTARPKPALSENEVDSEYPFARFVEVTGLRVVQLNDRSQVQYLVVNHSSAQLTNIGLHIAVRSVASPDVSLPIFTLAARVPSLGPHESKEIRTDLDSGLRSSQIPDWENLRTKVKIISPR